MTNNPKRLLYVFLLNVFGGVGLLAPLVGAVLCVQKKRWDLFIVSIVLFFVVKQLLFVVERRLNIRSSSNPESRYLGSGITFVAPWLKPKKKNIESNNNKEKRKNKGQ